MSVTTKVKTRVQPQISERYTEVRAEDATSRNVPKRTLENRAEHAAIHLESANIKTEADFNRFVKHRRAWAGLTHEEIAHSLGYSSGLYWGLIESGKRRIDSKKIPKLADELGLDRKEFCKMYIKVAEPNLYFALFGKEEIDLRSPDEQAWYAHISGPDVDLLNKVNTLPSDERSSVLTLVDLLTVKSREV